jgi:RNA polymerase sigma-70 factor (ECF subfamily)
MTRADLADSDLVPRLRNRDPETLDSLVRENSRPLYRAARGMGFREDEAEDLVQDVFATFLTTTQRFQGRSQVRTWLFGILHHKTLERWRQKEQESQHDPIDDLFESQFDAKGNWAEPPRDLLRLMESRELGEAIAGCLEGLPASQREAFVLREVEGLETAEICKILEVSATHMGVLMHRARNRLRECLEGRGWGRPG